MIDATLSHARMRDLACLGRARFARPAGAGHAKSHASRRQPGADASSIDASLPTRPKAASSRPERTIS